MSYTFRPAVREDTPLIIGIAGPTKSGKTFSALRLAAGLANGGKVIMLNAEGARGHQYADKFTYIACDLVPPYRYGMYEAVLREAAAQKPGAIIIDSMSHAHDGPGGFLEWHEEELDRIAGKDFEKRDKSNFTAWIKPKTAENAFRYALLEMPCHVILCMRAKDKLKILTGKPPIDLGLQPIVGESLSYETLFTLTLSAGAKGVPDLEASDMREPFDTMVPKGKPIDEQLGKQLVSWAKGASKRAPASPPAVLQVEPSAPPPKADDTVASLFAPAMEKAPAPKGPGIPGVDHPDERQSIVLLIDAEKAKLERQPTAQVWEKICEDVCGTTVLDMADPAALHDLLGMVKGLLAKDAGHIARVKKIMGLVAKDTAAA